MAPVTHEVTELLQDWGENDESALERLMPLVYDELHRLAHQQMRREMLGHILQTSALFNEAYLRLVDRPRIHGKIARSSSASPRASCAGFWLRRHASENQTSEAVA